MSYSLRDFGSYTAGGRVIEVTQGAPYRVQFTRSASFEVDPRGHFAVEHAYVQYFIPEALRDAPPVVLVHGGGMTGSCWETTPDGRKGWLHHLLQMGYEVHVVDAVERGRAGFAPGLWEGEPILRSLEEAWYLFRIGPKEAFARRQPFARQRFPVAEFESFCRSFVPRWLATTPLQVSGLLAVLNGTGPATVICHSQGAEVTFDALAQSPALFERIIAVEPSYTPDDSDALHDTSLSVLVGDFLDSDEFWDSRLRAWTTLAAFPKSTLLGPADLGAGHSHMLMLDQNSEHVLASVL